MRPTYLAMEDRGPVTICNKTSYRKISRSLKTARFMFRIVRSLCNFYRPFGSNNEIIQTSILAAPIFRETLRQNVSSDIISWPKCPLLRRYRHMDIEAFNPLHWRHNDHDGVSNHQPHGCLLNRLFGRRSKKTSKIHVTGLCAGKSPGPVNSPHKGPVTRKMFTFDDVIMHLCHRRHHISM